MAVTLRDVAKLAQTDITSVSNTLSDNPRAIALRPETRQRILAAAKQLGYRRNAFAASMRTGVNTTVAVIGDLESVGQKFFVTHSLAGIIKEATALGYGVKVFPDADIAKAVDEIRCHQIRHVIYLGLDEPKRIELAILCRQNELSLAYLYGRSFNGHPTVDPDNFDSARKAVLHLAAYGHKQIALLCAPHRFAYQDERHAGYLAGMKDAELKVDHKLIACTDAVEEAVNAMLELPDSDRPTAFFGITDPRAMIVQRLALKKGFRIPEDISTFGYGCALAANYAYSPICSVDEAHFEVGVAALQLLLGKPLDKNIRQTPEGKYLVPGKLVIRESVAQKCGWQA